MFDFLWSLGAFIVALGILVAVHEWGHFWVARRCGVKVSRFSIGFGKPLWRKTDKQGTEFVVAGIPLGGYVRMLDSRVDDVSPEDLPYAFDQQNVYKRIAIIAAGPITNFLFAILALFIMYLIGVQTIKPIIGEIKPDTPVASAGVLPGTEIIAVGDRDVQNWEGVNLELVSYIGKSDMTLTTLQQSNMAERQYQLDLSNWQFDPETESAYGSLGITPFRPNITQEIAHVAEDSPAKQAGIALGDKILGLDGTPVDNWEQIVEYVAARPGETVAIAIKRGTQETSVLARIGQREGNPEQGYLGVVPVAEEWPESYIFDLRYGPIGALTAAADKTWRLMTLSVEMIGKLITGDVSVKNLSGPISIAQGAGNSAGYGLVYFLSFLALISVNLGIINLLPLPVLDGGHLLYYFIELFTGRPVSESVQETGFKIGGALLFMLMAVAIFNDIARL
ncbi:MAG: sigma E protease regulator RseP [Aestuariibacter sp.]